MGNEYILVVVIKELANDKTVVKLHMENTDEEYCTPLLLSTSNMYLINL